MTITAPAVDLAAAYEALRAQAVGQMPAGTPRGLALFRRVGLAGWMPACAPISTQISTATTSAQVDGHRQRMPRVDLDGALVQILTEMALGSRRR